MNQRRFHMANIASAVIWAPAMIAPGWLAARGIAELEDLGESRWLAMGVAGLVLSALVVAIAFKLQRDRLERLMRRQRRLLRRENAASH
jgi:membrane protein DedA with SNARE-associated domain